MKKLAFYTVIAFVLALCSQVLASQSLSFLDESELVKEFKGHLITAGYLSRDESDSIVFNKRTKDAVIELQHDFSLDETGIASPEIQVIAPLLVQIENRTLPTSTDIPLVKIPDSC